MIVSNEPELSAQHLQLMLNPHASYLGTACGTETSAYAILLGYCLCHLTDDEMEEGQSGKPAWKKMSFLHCQGQRGRGDKELRGEEGSIQEARTT